MEYFEEYIYVKFEKVLEFKKRFFIMCLGLIFIYVLDPYVAINISTLIETILIFTIMFIATTIFKFSNKNIFKVIILLLLIVALLKFYTLTYLVLGVYEDTMIEYVKIKSVYISLILESIYSLFLIVSMKRKEIIKMWKIYFVIFIGIICLLVDDIYMFWGGALFLILVILLEIRDIELVKNKFLNHIKILLITNLLLIILDFFTFISGFVWILLITDILKIASYGLIYISVSEMLISKPYNFLNNKMTCRNNKISILNERMEESNREFKKFNTEIRSKETYFKDFLENVPTSMIILNKNNFRVFTTNKEFIKEIGVSEKRKIINKNIFNLIEVKNKEKFLLTKSGVASLEINGEKIFWEIEILAETKDDLIISLKNITEFKKSEKIREDLNKENLEEQIKNDFLSSISHDLKTPINVIYTSSQLQSKILESYDFEKIDYYNQVNKENCMILMRLANNLIDSSKIDCNYLKPNLQINNIVVLIEEAIYKLSEYIKDKNLEYIFDTNEEEIYIKCDQEFIQRIVINLISNSIKHTKEGGITINVKGGKNKVWIEFCDTGEGMDEEFLENACLRYYKGDKNGHGIKNKSTGIGLYIVKNLVELQKGKMKISSIKNVGTNVRIEFNREKIQGEL